MVFKVPCLESFLVNWILTGICFTQIKLDPEYFFKKAEFGNVHLDLTVTLERLRQKSWYKFGSNWLQDNSFNP